MRFSATASSCSVRGISSSFISLVPIKYFIDHSSTIFTKILEQSYFDSFIESILCFPNFRLEFANSKFKFHRKQFSICFRYYYCLFRNQFLLTTVHFVWTSFACIIEIARYPESIQYRYYLYFAKLIIINFKIIKIVHRLQYLWSTRQSSHCISDLEVIHYLW